MRVAYQGAPGAYSEGAALAAYQDCTPIPCEQFEVAFQALSQWIADRAVLPIENSLGGSIHSVYDLLLRYRLSIVGEVRRTYLENAPSYSASIVICAGACFPASLWMIFSRKRQPWSLCVSIALHHQHPEAHTFMNAASC